MKKSSGILSGVRDDHSNVPRLSISVSGGKRYLETAWTRLTDGAEHYQDDNRFYLGSLVYFIESMSYFFFLGAPNKAVQS